MVGATKTSLSTCGHDLIFFREREERKERKRKKFGAKDIEKWTIVNQDSKRLNLSLNAWTKIETKKWTKQRQKDEQNSDRKMKKITTGKWTDSKMDRQ